MRSWVVTYLIALATFAVLDGVWLGLVAASLYDDQLGPLLAEEPRALAAAVFYPAYLLGLCWFVIRPAAGSVRSAVRDGALFGAVTYATWDLTNLAVLEGFPVAIVPVDIAWGAVLCAVTAGVTVWLSGRLSGRLPGRVTGGRDRTLREPGPSA